MAKQTFSVGQVLTAAQVNALQANDYNQTVSTKTASYILVAADKGTRIVMNSTSATTITVNTGLFDAGDTLYIHNTNSGVCTITAGTATVATSGSLVLAQNQGGVLYFTSASASIFFQYATPASGDIEGVTAGTGISGGGTSGTVTITNSMATEITAAGDIIVGTGSGTFDNLPIGTTGQILTADTTVSPYKVKWATPASGGGMTLLSTTTMSGAVTTISSISGSYKQLYVIWYGMTNSTGSGYPELKFNNTGNYSGLKAISSSGTPVSQGENNVSIMRLSYGVNSFTNANNFAAMTINDYASTSNYKTFIISFGYNTSEIVNYTGIFLNNAAISELNFSNTGGNWSAGTVKIYGVN